MPERKQFPICIALTVKDMKRSLAFYRDTLGFELDKAWPDEAKALWANLRLDGQSVMLGALMTGSDAAAMCGHDADAVAHVKKLEEDFRKNKPGVGITTYLEVRDVDAFHAKVTQRGAKAKAPKTQFYGQRDFGVEDPDGYSLTFYMPVQMSSCQSCGMPLQDAKPGQMYCGYCTDDAGSLKPYEVVLEGTIQGYFMGMQKMARPQAEKAAREHLSKMPAWSMHK